MSVASFKTNYHSRAEFPGKPQGFLTIPAEMLFYPSPSSIRVPWLRRRTAIMASANISACRQATISSHPYQSMKNFLNFLEISSPVVT
jgi:hypothetical protein